MSDRIIVGITGASAPIYGIRLLEVLQGLPIETHLVMSAQAGVTMSYESPDWTAERVRALADVVHQPGNLAASIASGSFLTRGMVVAPCSMRTLASVATGLADNLLTRAADVILKERRRLVLVPRETPLHLGHLKSMAAVTEMGGVILPPMVAFYHRPQTIADIVDHTVGKVLDVLGIEHSLFRRWGS